MMSRSLLMLSLLVVCSMCMGGPRRLPRQKRSTCVKDPVNPGTPLMLTPMINSGNLTGARDAAKASIDGIDLGYSGFFTVKSKSGKNTNNMFTWFQPSTEGDVNSPFLLWMQGGPGAPSTYGTLVEVGPYYVGQDCKLHSRCFSWARNYNLIIIDQPVQTGFSFQLNASGQYDPNNIEYTKTSSEAAVQVLGVMQQFYTLFPEYKAAPLWITGESYGGNYVSNTAKVFLDNGLKVAGVSVGDPVLNAHVQFPTYGNTLYGMSLINLPQKEIIDREMSLSVAALPSSCQIAFNHWNNVWNDNGELDQPFYYKQFSGSSTTYEQLLTNDPDTFGLEGNWLDLPQVAKALHYGGTPNNQQAEGGEVYNTMVASGDFCQNSSDIYADLLLNYNINVQIYSSTNDPLLGPPTTEAGVNAMFDFAARTGGSRGRTLKSQWTEAHRLVWPEKTDSLYGVFGYATCLNTDKGADFCYTVIRNAGHMTPAFQPLSALDMTQRFISGKASYRGAGPPLPQCAPCGGSPPFAGIADPNCDN